MPTSNTTDTQLIGLMCDCWDENAANRPDFYTLRRRFMAINKGKCVIFLYIVICMTCTINKKPSSKLGWPHQRENAVSDGVVSRDLDFEGLPMRIWS